LLARPGGSGVGEFVVVGAIRRQQQIESENLVARVS
jgi:hypothetical protein